MIKASDLIVEELEANGLTDFFVFTGGAISHVIDSIGNSPKSRYFCFHHEQAAAFAAEAYSRTTLDGRVGTCLVTSGPGATNLLTGIAGAWFDSIPTLFLTGQVRTHEIGFESGQLQNGFQEVDIVSMARPVTKVAELLTDSKDLPGKVSALLASAKVGRPGPVLLDLPMDMQYSEFSSSSPSFGELPDETPRDHGLWMTLWDSLEVSRRPLILFGGGLHNTRSPEEIIRKVDSLGIPFALTYPSADLGSLSNHDAYLGVIGQYGNPVANEAVQHCDVLAVLGARLTQKQSVNSPELFANSARRIVVNLDVDELRDFRVPVEQVILGSIDDFIDASPARISIENDWKEKLRVRKEEVARTLSSVYSEDLGMRPHNPYRLATALHKTFPDDSIVITDVGQNVVAMTQFADIRPGVRMFSSWANSPMGYSLPASIGAAISRPGTNVYCVIGDGGIQVNIQELQTIATYGLDIKILLWNNHVYATIHEFQDPNLGGRHYATDSQHGYRHPDFERVAQAYGIRFVDGSNITNIAELQRILREPGAAIIHFEVDPSARLAPSVKGADPIDKMSDSLFGAWE